MGRKKREVDMKGFIEKYPNLWERAKRKYRLENARQKYFFLLIEEEKVKEMEARANKKRKEYEAKANARMVKAFFRNVIEGKIVVHFKNEKGELVPDPDLNVFFHLISNETQFKDGRHTIDGSVFLKERLNYIKKTIR